MRLSFSVFTILLCLSTIGKTQTAVALSELDKKSQKTYSKALKCLQKGKKEEAIKKLEEVIAKNPDFIIGSEKLAILYLDSNQDAKAVPLLESVDELSSTFKPKVKMTLSRSYEKNGNFDQAIAIIDELYSHQNLNVKSKPAVEKRLKELKFRKEAYDNPTAFQSVALPSHINTEKLQYHPVFNADRTTMLFVQLDNNHEEIYEVSQLELDSFSMPRNIEGVNTVYNEGAMCLSQNGKIMLFSAEGRRGSIGGYDIYITIKQGDYWSKPRNLGSTINSRYWDSTPSLSADNKTLFFSSKRPGGFGGSDIWKAELDKSGNWSKPENLGATINTAGNDEVPFIHPDGQSLYFVSDGHIGLGSYDIFVTEIKNDTTWSTPRNLGYPINNKDRQGGLYVDLEGNAYYSSQQANDTLKQTRPGDIYHFKLPETVRPKAVSYLRLMVIDAETNKNLKVSADVVNLATNIKTTVKTDEGGKALTTVGPGSYAVNVLEPGYLLHSEHIELDKNTKLSQPFDYVVKLVPLKKQEKPIVLNNIFFESGSAQLLDMSMLEIETLFNLLDQNEKLQIKIMGHTDNVGSESDNKTLSENRAKAVYDKLIEKGIDSNRLSYEGLGESIPLATNETEEGRQINRRTEFIEIQK